MAQKPFFVTLSFFYFLLSLCAANLSHFSLPQCAPQPPRISVPVFSYDADLLHFALNLEYTEAEWFLIGACGRGLDAIAPELAMGGPPPIGARQANLDNTTQRIIEEFGYQEVGHIRAIKSMVGGFPRQLINLSADNFARIFDAAFGYQLNPPFDPYINTLNYLLASYLVPYVGLVGYVGSNPNIDGFLSKRLVAGLLAIEGGQDAIIRSLLYERAHEIVPPYKNYTVADFTIRLSNLRNQLAMCGIKDEGLIVPAELGAERRTTSNILSANEDSLGYRRTPAEILRIMYGTGDEHTPGGFWPKGGAGKIAKEYLLYPH